MLTNKYNDIIVEVTGQIGIIKVHMFSHSLLFLLLLRACSSTVLKALIPLVESSYKRLYLLSES
jgi:hypothetical protein